MKSWKTYLISTITFFLVFTLMEYLFTKDFDWVISIITTVIYCIANIVCDILFIKKFK